MTAENVSGDADNKRYILETTGDGVAIFDLDNDGLMDILLVNATTMDGKGRGEKSTSHLYRNIGNLHFVDITQKAGLGKVGWGQGVCVGTTTTMASKICLLPTTGTAFCTTTRATAASRMSPKRQG